MKIIKTLITSTLLAVSFSAMAHSGLISASPSKDQVLTTSPATLKLEFSGNVNLLKLAITDQQQQSVAIDFAPTTNMSDQYEFTLPELAASQYKVSWMVIGKDTHKIKGQFNFTVDPAQTESESELESESDVEIESESETKHSHQH